MKFDWYWILVAFYAGMGVAIFLMGICGGGRRDDDITSTNGGTP